MSVLARAGDVETQHPEADGHQTSAGEIFTVLVQAQHENDSRDNPSVTKKAGAPGGDGNHGTNMPSGGYFGNMWLLECLQIVYLSQDIATYSVCSHISEVTYVLGAKPSAVRT